MLRCSDAFYFHQQTVAGISHISFGEEESVSPKKALSEAKQRELSGTLDSESDSKLKKQFSNAKNKELSGHNIFAPPPEIKPRPLGNRALALRESISIGESAPNNVHTSFMLPCMIKFNIDIMHTQTYYISKLHVSLV